MFTRQLASLIVSRPAARRSGWARWPTEAGAHLCTRIAGGDSRRSPWGAARCSVALTQHPKDFPDIYRALVSAGEHSGHLERWCWSGLATYIETIAMRSTSKIRLGLHLSDHRHSGGICDRDLPAVVCGAAGGQRVCQYQAEAADPDDRHAGAVGLRAELVVGGARPSIGAAALLVRSLLRAARRAAGVATAGC